MTWIAAANIGLLFALAVNQLCLRRYGLAAVLVVSGLVWTLTMADMPTNHMDHIHFGEFCLSQGSGDKPPAPARSMTVRFHVVDRPDFGEVMMRSDWHPWLGG